MSPTEIDHSSHIEAEPATQVAERTLFSPQVIVLATTSQRTVGVAQELYGDEFEMKNLAPMWEPKKGRSRRAATAKNNQVVLSYQEVQEEIVISGDVAFIWNDKPQHRPDREQNPSQVQIEKKARNRYQRPFKATWEVTFAATKLPGKERRLTTVVITADFSNGLSEDEIKKNILLCSNSLLALVELGAEKGVHFSIEDKKNGSESYPLSGELAVLLIRDKVLPKEAFKEFINATASKESEYVERKIQVVWSVIPLALLTFFSQQQSDIV